MVPFQNCLEVMSGWAFSSFTDDFKSPCRLIVIPSKLAIEDWYFERLEIRSTFKQNIEIFGKSLWIRFASWQTIIALL